MFLVSSERGTHKYDTIEEAYEEATKRVLNSESVTVVHVLDDGAAVVAKLQYYEPDPPS